MSEQRVAVRGHVGESLDRHRGDRDEGEGTDWPLAAPIFAAVAGLYGGAAVGIYAFLASASREILVSAGLVALSVSSALFAILLASEVDRQRMRMRTSRTE